MPRPHAITAAKRDKMLLSLRGGALYRDAAEAAGIPWRTWVRWCRSVREDECDNPDVIELVSAARSAYHATNVGLSAAVAKAAAKDWRAAAWALEHRRGDPKARHDQKRARYEAAAAKAKADAEASGKGPPTVVVELPASLARPREG